ncbi:MAG TPA: glycoside hydrolase family 3 C-terminal domain-containing protein [Tepidisphaeraceae bacterium]
MKNILAALLAVLIIGCQSHHAPPAAGTQPDVGAGSATGLPADNGPDARADALISQMTLDEKISLLGGDTDAFSTHAVKRLGIPKLTMADGPQGIRNYPPSCSFPCGAALAATWDTNLARAYGSAMGLEARARGVNFILGPGMNICRVPVNGRNFEYFGEDPFLAGKIAANWVRAAESQGVIATIKHYAANNQEWNRNSEDELIDRRTLEEIYLPAFRRAVQEGGAGAVMAAYNRVNGVYCAENDVLLNQILKGDWHFKGIVMSDWGACHSTASLAHGLDLEMGQAVYFKPDKIKEAIENRQILESDVNNAAHRILSTAIGMGFFDRPQTRPDLPLESPASDQAALDIARSAIVLLKNDSTTLPLDRSAIHRIAVYGPNAEDTPTGGGGSGAVKPFHSVSFLQGIKSIAGAGVEVSYTPMAPADDSLFRKLDCAYTADNGQSGLVMNVTINSPGHDVSRAPTIVQSVNLLWKAGGELPYAIPKGKDATYTWTGVLIPPQDGDWEIISHGYIQISLGGKPLLWPAGEILHLKKDSPLPIQIHAEGRADGKWPGLAQVALRPVAMPDLTAAKSADAVIVCAGFDGRSEHEGNDRDFELSEMQQRLISGLAAVNPKTVVVLNSGAGVGMENWFDAIPAIVQAWYIGQDGGTALGEVLFGDVNPSGRLPSTFDRKFEDNPAFANYPGEFVPHQDWPVEHYSEGIFIGYRGYDKSQKDPLFPFGYGLSYTTFDFANMKLEKTDGGVRVRLDVTNTGHVAGAEVVQVYVGQDQSLVERPARELKGFTKVMLKAGETQNVEIVLPRDSFSFWSSAKNDWTIEPGVFTIEAGASERDIRSKENVTIDWNSVQP